MYPALCHPWSLSTALAGGSRDNKLRSSELCCLSSVSRGTVPALFLFPPVRRFPEMLLASQNSSRNSAQRLAMRQTASCLQAHAVSGMLEAPLSSFALAQKIFPFILLQAEFDFPLRRREGRQNMSEGAFPIPAVSEGACCLSRRSHPLPSMLGSASGIIFVYKGQL